jgi:NADPH:quinone reductase-like Zn-dependent oxidoreductase
MRGEPRIARLNRTVFGRSGPRVPTPGTDLAGTVVAAGDGVSRWTPGDAVTGEGTGALAEYAVVRSEQIAAVPAGVSFEQAAALPLAATTASVCVDAAIPAPGRTILVNGASGGVGTFAIQLARQQQMVVTAVVSPRNTAQATRLGADTVIDYTTDDFTRTGQQYDAVLDLVGNHSLRDLRRVVRPGGALVLSGGGVPGSGRYLGPLPLLVRASIGRRRSAAQILVPQARPDAAMLDHLLGFVAGHRLEPVIDRRFPLEAVAEAFDYMESTHASGKVIIEVS